MQILASALPGARDLRAPLIAGYLWLLLLWLGLEPHVHRAGATGALAAAFNLGDSIGKVGLTVAVSVLAYLLGCISQELSPAVRRLVVIARRGLVVTADSLAFAGLSEQIAERIDVEQRAWLQEHRPIIHSVLATVPAQPMRNIDERDADAYIHEKHTVRDRLDQIRDFATQAPQRDERDAATWRRLCMFIDELLTRRSALLEQVRNEMRLPANLLVGDQPELFAEVDRLRSESELRLIAVPPLVSLTVFLSVAMSPIWLAVAPLITVLAIQGTQRYEESTGTVANAAYFGKLRLVSIASYRDWVQQMAPPQPELSPSVEGGLAELGIEMSALTGPSASR